MKLAVSIVIIFWNFLYYGARTTFNTILYKKSTFALITEKIGA
nr:hypothetical protein [Brevibacillus laterosporus]